MKIIRDNCVYIQKNDIAFLNSIDTPFPASIFLQLFGNNNSFYVNDSNRYEFMKFEGSSQIDFFNNLDYIINYDDVKDLSIEELTKLGQNMAKEKNVNNDLIEKCNILDFKMYSLRDFLWFKQGNLKMVLPDGIDYPLDCFYKPKINDNIVQKLIRYLKKK